MTPSVAALVDLALEEDLGRGDVTSASVLGSTMKIGTTLAPASST